LGLDTSVTTSPGPALTVQGNLVNLTLTSVDDKTHNFFVDYYGNRTAAPGDSILPNFPSEGPPYEPTINYQFTANRLGTFTYYCQYDKKLMNGTLIVVPTPTQTITIGNQSIFLNRWRIWQSNLCLECAKYLRHVLL
jgi:heme/copper-type cytochrome/quinol oxidase subunit 2